MAATDLVAAIRGGLAPLADPVRAEQEKAYLKSSLRFLGVSVPGVRSVVRAALKAHGADISVCAVASGLWDSDVYEHRAAAVELLEMRQTDLRGGDIALLERLIRESGTWALVDNLAASVGGPLLDRQPELGEVIARWADDEDFWLRRSALLVHLVPLRQGAGDWDRFAALADPMMEEKEFFIRKAIGWVLRDTAKRRPDLVTSWLLPRAHRASGVTLREAIKPLSEVQRAAVRRAAADRPR